MTIILLKTVKYLYSFQNMEKSQNQLTNPFLKQSGISKIFV